MIVVTTDTDLRPGSDPGQMGAYPEPVLRAMMSAELVLFMRGELFTVVKDRARPERVGEVYGTNEFPWQEEMA